MDQKEREREILKDEEGELSRCFGKSSERNSEMMKFDRRGAFLMLFDSEHEGS